MRALDRRASFGDEFRRLGEWWKRGEAELEGHLPILTEASIAQLDHLEQAQMAFAASSANLLDLEGALREMLVEVSRSALLPGMVLPGDVDDMVENLELLVCHGRVAVLRAACQLRERFGLLVEAEELAQNGRVQFFELEDALRAAGAAPRAILAAIAASAEQEGKGEALGELNERLAALERRLKELPVAADQEGNGSDWQNAHDTVVATHSSLQVLEGPHLGLLRELDESCGRMAAAATHIKAAGAELGIISTKDKAAKVALEAALDCQEAEREVQVEILEKIQLGLRLIQRHADELLRAVEVMHQEAEKLREHWMVQVGAISELGMQFRMLEGGSARLRTELEATAERRRQAEQEAMEARLREMREAAIREREAAERRLQLALEEARHREAAERMAREQQRREQERLLMEARRLEAELARQRDEADRRRAEEARRRRRKRFLFF